MDKGDLDAVNVHPLPAQERILEAFGRLGFRFKGADLERGHLRGVHQTLPFYQEIEFYPAPQYASAINEVEVTFVANPHGVDVVLEFDKRGGLFTVGHGRDQPVPGRPPRRRHGRLGAAGRRLGPPGAQRRAASSSPSRT